MTEKFGYTLTGYAQAKEFLKAIGAWEQVSAMGLSMDGYSIVHEANSIYAQLSQDITVPIENHFAGDYRLEYDGKYVTLYGNDYRYPVPNYGGYIDPEYEEMVLVPVVTECRHATPSITKVDDDYIYISLLPNHLK